MSSVPVHQNFDLVTPYLVTNFSLVASGLLTILPNKPRHLTFDLVTFFLLPIGVTKSKVKYWGLLGKMVSRHDVTKLKFVTK